MAINYALTKINTLNSLYLGIPWNLTVFPGDNYNYIISWHAPQDMDVHISYYTIKYKLDTDSDYKTLANQVKAPQTSFSSKC